jgi:hypothetical protein
MEHNTFRHIDALEYANAWNICKRLGVLSIESRARALSERMGDMEQRGEEIPSYLLAAYRAYEAARVFRENPDAFNQAEPFVVILSATG